MLLWLLLLSLFSLEATADERPPPLLEFQDPFWIGPAANFSVSNWQGGGSHIQRLARWELDYGWDSGNTINLILPVVLADSITTPNGAASPRIGGGADPRIELSSSWRFWGDAKDYVGLSIGLGLPIQSDSQERLSQDSAWSLPTALQWRLDGDILAWGGRFDYVYLFSTTSQPSGGGSVYYYDKTNSETLLNTFSFFSHRRFSPYLSWQEEFPSALDIETLDSPRFFGAPTSALVTSSVHTGRARSFGLGFNCLPLSRPFVLTSEVKYHAKNAADTDSKWELNGAIRWVF